MVDLKSMVQVLINEEIAATYNAGRYLESLKAHIYSRPGQCITIYEAEILEDPSSRWSLPPRSLKTFFAPPKRATLDSRNPSHPQCRGQCVDHGQRQTL